MNRIYTGFVSDPNIQQPFTAKSLDFLQDSIKEAVKANCYGKIGGSLAGYQQITGGAIIFGCNYSGSGNTIYNGFILWQDELFYFPGAMGLLVYSNVPVVVLDETNDASIDPVEFSDNVFRSVHKIRRLKVVDQVSGSGLFDLSKLQGVIKATELTGTSTTTVSAALTAIPNTSFTSPNRLCDLEIKLEGWAYAPGGVTAEGGKFKIYNVTAGAVIREGVATVVTNGVNAYYSVSVSVVVRNVAANTQIQGYIQRFATNNFTFDNPILTYRELVDRN